MLQRKIYPGKVDKSKRYRQIVRTSSWVGQMYESLTSDMLRSCQLHAPTGLNATSHLLRHLLPSIARELPRPPPRRSPTSLELIR